MTHATVPTDTTPPGPQSNATTLEPLPLEQLDEAPARPAAATLPSPGSLGSEPPDRPPVDGVLTLLTRSSGAGVHTQGVALAPGHQCPGSRDGEEALRPAGTKPPALGEFTVRSLRST